MNISAFKDLKEAGLDDSEIQVYLACLSGGEQNVKEISQHTGIIRTTVYGIADSLTRKGIISVVNKEGEKTYHAAKPEEFLNILDGRRQKIEALIPELSRYTPMLAAIHKVEFFEGRNGVKAITNDLLSKPNTLVKVVGAGRKWYDFSQSFAAVYYRKKKERGVRTVTILSDTPDERSFAKSALAKNSEFRFMKNMQCTNVAMFIYQDKVSFVSYEDSPRGFIITDSAFNLVQNMFFSQLWTTSKA
jgi:sugar-specific transcriptional regulator TrmB